MHTERNLLFAILARLLGFVRESQLLEAAGELREQRQLDLGELLINRGVLDSHNCTEIERHVATILASHNGDAVAALAATVRGPQELALALEAVGLHRSTVDAGCPQDGSAPTREPDAGMTMLGQDAEISSRYLQERALSRGPRYKRTTLHASGGMGTVWLARDQRIGRDVALKELRAEAAGPGRIPVRFLREARITGQLEHPGVVPVYELGIDPESHRPFYTMRFFRGSTLTAAAQTWHRHRNQGVDDPLELVNLLTAFVSVCQTIAYAHSHGIIHRDLKGDNIILGDFGEVIVLDWGLAKRITTADDEIDDAYDRSTSLPNQTVIGQVMGTPAYMAPEQAEGRSDLVGPATDIFGLGAILYEILSGSPPFAGTNTFEVLERAQRAEIQPPRTYWPDVPPTLEAICLKAMAKESADRHLTALDLAKEVQGWQDRQRRQAENQLRKAGERLIRQQQALVELTRDDVLASPSLEDTYRRLIQNSAVTLGVERVSVWRYTDDRSAIRCATLYELSSGRYSGGTELRQADFPGYFSALETNEVIPAQDATQDPRTREFTETYLTPLGIGAIMDAPIHVAGEMLGVVCHEHIGGARNWTNDEQVFAIAISNLVSQAISLWERRMNGKP